MADIVQVQRWMLAVPDAQLTYWIAADRNKDKTVDVFDLALMKRKLLEG